MNDRKSADKHADKHQEAAERLAWEITSASIRLDELRQYWAKAIGVTAPQWMIMMVLANADDPKVGLAVGAVSKALHVDQSFVGTQSKALERKNLLRRDSSPEDARVVNLSLTELGRKQLASLGAMRLQTSRFVYSDLDLQEITELTDKLAHIRTRLGKAILKLSEGI